MSSFLSFIRTHYGEKNSESGARRNLSSPIDEHERLCLFSQGMTHCHLSKKGVKLNRIPSIFCAWSSVSFRSEEVLVKSLDIDGLGGGDSQTAGYHVAGEFLAIDEDKLGLFLFSGGVAGSLGEVRRCDEERLADGRVTGESTDELLHFRAPDIVAGIAFCLGVDDAEAERILIDHPVDSAISAGFCHTIELFEFAAVAHGLEEFDDKAFKESEVFFLYSVEDNALESLRDGAVSREDALLGIFLHVCGASTSSSGEGETEFVAGAVAAGVFGLLAWGSVIVVGALSGAQPLRRFWR